MIVEEYKGYTIETDQRNPYAQKDEVEYMFYPTKEGIQDDMDCTDGESFTYCGNCKWASTIEEAYDEIDELTYDDMKVHEMGHLNEDHSER